jgi:hypothetical protein
MNYLELPSGNKDRPDFELGAAQQLTRFIDEADYHAGDSPFDKVGHT